MEDIYTCFRGPHAVNGAPDTDRFKNSKTKQSTPVFPDASVPLLHTFLLADTSYQTLATLNDCPTTGGVRQVTSTTLLTCRAWIRHEHEYQYVPQVNQKTHSYLAF
jgi:hypothetical protein